MTELIRTAIPELLAWYRVNKREMPWRDTPDFWKVWVSEIMLQQTQVETVRPYFTEFISKFPDVHSLVRAEEQEVLKAWEGLGYYTRARNLQKAARKVSAEMNGQLPKSFSRLLDLPGLGPYSAAAIASIVFKEPVPAVDGNVLRVFTRLTELGDDISRPQTRTLVFGILSDVISGFPPGDFNQAMMELGAIVCKPRQPDCPVCPLNRICASYKNGTQLRFPVKKKAAVKPHHLIGVGICMREGKVLIARRHEKQMLAGLWEFPGGKIENGETEEECILREMREETGLTVELVRKIAKTDHAFTHFSITLNAWLCNWVSGEAQPLSGSEIRWILPEELDDYPFPKANKVIIKEFRSAVK